MTRKIIHGFKRSEISDLDLELIDEALCDLEQVKRYQAGLLPQGMERQKLMNDAQRAQRIIEKIRIDIEGENSE
jgi:hypothetical protein